MSTNKLLFTSLAITCMVFFNGCGGGSSVNGTTPSNTQQPLYQPHELSARDFQSVDVLTPPDFPGIPAPKVTDDTNSITITYFGSEQAPMEHNQFFLNIDNNTSTGFQFDGEAWDNAGTDYIIEDGHLFKSTANDSSWSWNESVGEIIYKRTPTSVSATIKKSLLEGLTPTIHIGLVKRDDQWNVLNFYPQSSQMAEYTINIPPSGTDTTVPDIKMNGAAYIEIRKGSTFTDPGATAKDDVDGNITANITVQSNLDVNKLGTYKITYRVSDAAGNTNDATRTVKVLTNTPTDIIIDGNKSDWADKTAISTGQGTLKAYDTAEKIFLLFDAHEVPFLENTQFFLDVDNDTGTGFQFNGSIWHRGGADYMIENDHLDKAKDNNSSWAWDYNTAPIEYAKIHNIIEVAIPKSALENLGSTINIGFVERNKQWNINLQAISNGLVNYQLGTTPEQAKLTLLPNFCRSDLWETRDTPETTKINDHFTKNNVIQHNGFWYGVDEITNSNGEKEISIVKYDGEHIRQILPFHLVKQEPLTNSIRSLQFVDNTLYFNYGSELWSNSKINGVQKFHLVKKFAESTHFSGVYPSKNYISVLIRTPYPNRGYDTWVVEKSTDTTNEKVYKLDALRGATIELSDPNLDDIYLKVSARQYKKFDGSNITDLDYIPLKIKGTSIYYAKPTGDRENHTIYFEKDNVTTPLKTVDNVPIRRSFLVYGNNIFALKIGERVSSGFDWYTWLVNFDTQKFTKIENKDTNEMRDIFTLDNQTFYVYNEKVAGTWTRSLYKKGNNSENDKKLAALTRSGFNTRLVDEKLYIIFQNSNVQPWQKGFIGMISSNTGKINNLGLCR